MQPKKLKEGIPSIGVERFLYHNNSASKALDDLKEMFSISDEARALLNSLIACETAAKLSYDISATGDQIKQLLYDCDTRILVYQQLLAIADNNIKS